MVVVVVLGLGRLSKGEEEDERVVAKGEGKRSEVVVGV